MTEFTGGLELSGLFYEEAVRPILETEFPGLDYSAALIGSGSDVLGYDTPRSTDHEWGPRLLLFLSEGDHRQYARSIDEVLSAKLSPTFRGYSTHFGPTDEEGVRCAAEWVSGPIVHKVELHTVSEYLNTWLGFDPREGMHAADWLALPQQRLLEVTAGGVFHDGLDELEPIRAKLAYYPHDVWLYILACQWRRISQQEAFVGRTGEVGDDLGSRLVAAGLVRDLIFLLFLMERKYAPYSKWLGTAFSRLQSAPTFGPLFNKALQARTWQQREQPLARAYELAAEMHNELGITPPLDTKPRYFFGRPFLVLFADRFSEAILAAITDPEVKAVRSPIGSVDQLSDSTDVLSYPQVYRKLRVLYTA